jgi:putative transposase
MNGRQTSLPFGAGWGGRRAGAGRKPKLARAGVPHIARPPHARRNPLHVTVRVREGLPNLRGQSLFQCIQRQIGAAKARLIRIVHFSVQSNHLHLIVEAGDRRSLARGMKGFGVRVARHVNALLSTRGTVWADRYHARALETPREVRNALVYVLFNRRKHGGSANADPCSSVAFFSGWQESALAKAFAHARVQPRSRGSAEGWPVARPETWLLTIGWKRPSIVAS